MSDPFHNRTVWRSAPYVSDANPIVIGGCGRSGTTLLRVMLDSHPHICAGPESLLFLDRHLAPDWIDELAAKFDMDSDFVHGLLRSAPSQAEFVDRFFSHYCILTRKPRWAEKTPRNVEVLNFVFAHFPAARFIHVIRDGRDTACSLRTHPRHDFVGGDLVTVPTRHPMEQCIQRWVRDVGLGLGYRDHPGYTEVRYEDLVTAPEPTLRQLFEWLEEPWSDAVLRFSEVHTPSREVWKFAQNPEATQPLYHSSIGRWRSDMSRDDAALFKILAGPLLIALRYAEDEAWQPDAHHAGPEPGPF